MSKKKNKELENGSFEETIEMRMTDLETQMTMFKTVFIRKEHKTNQTTKKFRVISILLCKKNTELDKVVLTIKLSGDKLAKKSGDNLVVTWQQFGDNLMVL